MPADTTPPAGEILKTPFHAQHAALGARMVPFAGYDMPVQYRDGIIAEHNWTRANAGLFDVSHMGQAWLTGPDQDCTAQALEALCPAAIRGLERGRQRYSQLLDAEGGILDDFMVSRPLDAGAGGRLFLVVNAARKALDYAHIAHRLPPGVHLMTLEDRALLALQGPKAHDVAVSLGAQADAMKFMDVIETEMAGIACQISRSGYTGEDGYEISVAQDHAEELWLALLEDERVKPIGLGARDSLRLEAGLCLYGHDIDETTSPVEAGLAWSIQKSRREDGGFPGAKRILRELKDGPSRKRVGLELEGRQPVREGAEITTRDGKVTGRVTSGGFSPTLQRPIAMGYVQSGHAAVGTQLEIHVRGKALPARVVSMPFVPHRYKR